MHPADQPEPSLEELAGHYRWLASALEPRKANFGTYQVDRRPSLEYLGVFAVVIFLRWGNT